MPTHLQLEVCLVVVALAATQSVFGVGLLVFGTPILLLLGLPFAEVLTYLLPSSIAISALQVWEGGGIRPLEPIRKKFLTFTAPGVLVGTVVILGVGSTLQIKPIVGAMLVVTALLRAVAPLRRALEGFIRRHTSPLLVGLGLLHGLSNLGGGVLTVIVGSVEEGKRDIRRHIAFAYGLMASVQLVVVFVTTSVSPVWSLWLLLPVLAVATYFLVGRRLFEWAPQERYQMALTGLILAFGVVLLLPT
jgi:hypothetical protein